MPRRRPPRGVEERLHAIRFGVGVLLGMNDPSATVTTTAPRQLTKTEYLESIKANLRAKIAQAGALNPGAPTWWQFVLANGRGFKEFAPPSTKYLPWVRRPHLCFSNCLQLAVMRADLVYVEGYAIIADTGIDVEHAWCVDKAGRIYDPTWTANSEVGAAYFGVPFSRAYAVGRYEIQAKKNGFVGSFWETGDDDWALMKGKVEGAVEMHLLAAR
jgi:hypothetical protein